MKNTQTSTVHPLKFKNGLHIHEYKSRLIQLMIEAYDHDDVINVNIFSALLAICAGNSPVAGDFLAQRPVTRSFDVFFDLHVNKRLSKQWRDWWFETPSRPLWRQYNDILQVWF